jgi:hypothetical protein
MAVFDRRRDGNRTQWTSAGMEIDIGPVPNVPTGCIVIGHGVNSPHLVVIDEVSRQVDGRLVKL